MYIGRIILNVTVKDTPERTSTHAHYHLFETLVNPSSAKLCNWTSFRGKASSTLPIQQHHPQIQRTIYTTYCHRNWSVPLLLGPLTLQLPAHPHIQYEDSHTLWMSTVNQIKGVLPSLSNLPRSGLVVAATAIKFPYSRLLFSGSNSLKVRYVR